jgi:hypothetical protein
LIFFNTSNISRKEAGKLALLTLIAEGRRKKEEGRRKKEEGRRKKEEVIMARVSALNNVLTVLAVAISTIDCKVHRYYDNPK